MGTSRRRRNLVAACADSSRPASASSPRPSGRSTPAVPPSSTTPGPLVSRSTPPATTAPQPSAPAPPSSSTPSPAGILGPGSSGRAVLDLQRQLNALGYWLGTPNGAYGQLTAQAVTALQKAAGLPRDGVFGPLTAQALARGIRPAARSASGHVIEVDLARQVLLIVTNGSVDTVLDTSTGSGATYTVDGQTALAVTPTGVYRIFRQVDGSDRSPLGVLWRPKYFNGGIAVHGYPDVPPYPASHGCVRVSDAAIDWIWADNLAPVGTSVWVY